MSKKEQHINDYLGKDKRRQRKSWMVALFVLMMALVTASWLIFRQAKVYQETYEQEISQTQWHNIAQEHTSQGLNQRLQHQQAITLLLVGIGYQEAGRLGSPQAQVIEAVTLSPRQESGLIVSVYPDLPLASSGDLPLGEVYAESSMDQLVSEVESLLDQSVDGVIQLDMTRLRDWVDQLGGLELVNQDPILIDGERLQVGETIELTGRQLGQYILPAEGEGAAASYDRQRRVVEAVLQQLLDELNLTNARQIMQALSEIVYTDIQLNHWVNMWLRSYQPAWQQAQLHRLTLTEPAQVAEVQTQVEQLYQDHASHES